MRRALDIASLALDLYVVGLAGYAIYWSASTLIGFFS